MQNYSLEQESLGRKILKDSGVQAIDPLSILIILRIVISILIFLGENWKTPNQLPLWKKIVIRFELVKKFGRKQAKEIEKQIYFNISNMTQEEVKGLVEVKDW